MSYFRYLCLFAYSVVQHILCCVFCFCLSSSLVPKCCQFLWTVPSVFSHAYYAIKENMMLHVK